MRTRARSRWLLGRPIHCCGPSPGSRQWRPGPPKRPSADRPDPLPHRSPGTGRPSATVGPCGVGTNFAAGTGRRHSGLRMRPRGRTYRTPRSCTKNSAISSSRRIALIPPRQGPTSTSSGQCRIAPIAAVSYSFPGRTRQPGRPDSGPRKDPVTNE